MSKSKKNKHNKASVRSQECYLWEEGGNNEGEALRRLYGTGNDLLLNRYSDFPPVNSNISFSSTFVVLF